MEQKTLERTIDTLSKIINIPEEKRKELFDRYINMSEKEVIRDLSKKVYQVLGPDSTYYDYALTIVRNIKRQQRSSRMFTREV